MIRSDAYMTMLARPVSGVDINLNLSSSEVMPGRRLVAAGRGLIYVFLADRCSPQMAVVVDPAAAVPLNRETPSTIPERLEMCILR